jgi:zinc and cadmium transporter
MTNTLLIQILWFTLVGGLFSLIGGFFLLWQERLIRRIADHLFTFAAGTLLGVTFLDLLPEAFAAGLPAGFTVDDLLGWTLGGLLTFFLIELILRKVHADSDAARDLPGSRADTPWLVTIGDSVHNFVDGLAIGTSFLASGPIGILTTLGVAAHEIPQEMADFSILLHAGWSKRAVIWSNIASSFVAVLGGLIAYALRDAIEPWLAPLLAATGGMFLYIAAATLIPEIHHRRPDTSWHVVVALGVGVTTVWLLTRLIGE